MDIKVHKYEYDGKETSFKYIDWEEPDIIDAPMWYHKRGLQQTATGYGSKLNTGKKLMVGNRSYRIYCICYSNSGSNYIIVKGERIYLR